MNLLPQAYLLDVIAGCLAIVIGFRFFLEYRYGTVFTSYAQMIGKDQKKITRKKEQALFLTILCPTLLCHIAFRSVFGTGTLMLLSWIILWYVIYTIAFHFYAKSNPISPQPEDPSEKHEERKTKGNSSEDDESGSQKKILKILNWPENEILPISRPISMSLHIQLYLDKNESCSAGFSACGGSRQQHFHLCRSAIPAEHFYITENGVSCDIKILLRSGLFCRQIAGTYITFLAIIQHSVPSVSAFFNSGHRLAAGQLAQHRR